MDRLCRLLLALASSLVTVTVYSMVVTRSSAVTRTFTSLALAVPTRRFSTKNPPMGWGSASSLRRDTTTVAGGDGAEVWAVTITLLLLNGTVVV